ncbi:MAG TPA: cysteine hydrolase family protein [Acidimicrobiia bacterium]
MTHDVSRGAPQPPHFYEYRKAMLDFKFDAAKSALLIVDLQYGSAHRDLGYSAAYAALGFTEVVDAYMDRLHNIVLPNVRRLQESFRAVGAPVIFFTVGTVTGDFSDMPPRFKRGLDFWESKGVKDPYSRLGTREITVLDEIAPQPGELVFTKTTASAFTSTPIDTELRSRGIEMLAICGVSTNYCVESTLRDASDFGYDVALVEDASADSNRDSHDRGVRGCGAFGRVLTTEEVIAEIAF